MCYQLIFILFSLTTFLGIYAAGPKPCGNSADVAFIVDASRSIRRPGFQKQVQFVEDMASAYNIAPDKTQIAVASFSEGVREEFLFNKYDNKDDVLSAIKDITNTRGGRTDTGEALNYVREVIFTPENGARSNVPHIVIFTTDGRPTNPYIIDDAARKLREENIILFAIGVGDVDIGVLNQIAFKPTPEYVTKVDNFTQLASIQDKLALQACKALTTAPPPTTTTTPKPTTTQPPTTTEEKMQGDRPDSGCVTGKDSDVIFVLDESSSIDNKDFAKQLTFVNDVISMFAIGPRKTQIGVVTFSDNPTIEFSLNRYTRKKDVMNAVKRIKYSGGNTYTNLALEVVRDELLSPKNGARPGVAKIVVVITDGVSRMPKNTAAVAEEIKKRGVYMFAIGVGKEFDQDIEELQNIASSPAENFVQTVNGYNALGTIKDLLSLKKCKTPGGEQNDILTPCGSQYPADVMFVTDFSKSNSTEVTSILQNIGNVAQGLDVGRQKVHVGLTSSDCPEVGDINPLQYYDGTSFAMALRLRIETQVSKLIERAKKTLTGKYSRKGSKRVIVFYTTGPIDDFEATAREIMRAKHRIYGIDFIVVAASPSADKVLGDLPVNKRIYHKDVQYGQSILNRICDAIRA